MKKKVLVLYATYGSGHKAIANYIKKYFEKENENVEIFTIDILQYSLPFIGKFSSKISEYLMANLPIIWDVFYKMSDNKVNAKLTEKVCLKIFKNKKLKRAITEINPELTISTHFFCTPLIAYYNKQGFTDSKIITIVTDYAAHELWLNSHDYMDYLIVSSKEEKKYLVSKRNFSKDKVKAYGIPIFPETNSNFDKRSVLLSLGLDTNKLTCVFFAGGGNGYSATLPYVKKLLKMKLPLNFVFISGKNKKAEKRINEYVKKYGNQNCKIYGYVNNVPELLQVADFVVTKPGGIQTTECLYFKKPMLILKVISGCENENMKYLVKKGYGKMFRFPITFANFVKKVANNNNILNRFNYELNKMNNKSAMEKIYKLTNNLLNK